MAGTKGNQFWKARSRSGRDKIFKDSASLWRAACKYFEWVEDNPLLEQKAVQFQGVFVKDTVTKMRAMTITGICRFLHINFQTWQNYKKDDDFLDIIEEIESIIYDQKFTGAAADLLNPNIIARELGLADKKDERKIGPNGEVLDTTQQVLVLKEEYVVPEPVEE